MPFAELIEFLAILMVAGAGAGLIAGLFGVGGGIIIVPVLFFIFKMINITPDIAIHAAVGTSLATIIPTSISSLRAHIKRKAVDHTIIRQWGPDVVIGAAIGSLIANMLSGAALSLTFGVFAIFIAALMGLAPPALRVAKEPPKGVAQKILAASIGFISAVVGVGGGSMSVPSMVLCNVPIHRAIGTAAAIGLFISLPGTFVFLFANPGGAVPPYSFGLINLPALAVLAPVTMLTAPQGAKLAHKLPAPKLRRIFSIFLFLIAIRMIVSAR